MTNVMEDNIRRGIKKDWGKGIPIYTERDLMTKEEIHDFALEVIFGILKNDGYEILHMNRDYGVNPSYVCEKEGKKYAIHLSSDIAPNHPTLSSTDKNQLIKYCDLHDLNPVFCPVSFGAIDAERFDKGIALVGDGYYCNFKGFEFIEKIKKHKDYYFVKFLVDMFYFDFLEEQEKFEMKHKKTGEIISHPTSRLMLEIESTKYTHRKHIQLDSNKLEVIIENVASELVDKILIEYKNDVGMFSPKFDRVEEFYDYYLKKELYLVEKYLKKTLIEKFIFKQLGFNLTQYEMNIFDKSPQNLQKIHNLMNDNHESVINWAKIKSAYIRFKFSKDKMN